MDMPDQAGAPVLVYSAEDTFEDWERKAAAVMVGCPDVALQRALDRLYVVDKTEGIAQLSELVQVRSDLGAESITRREPRATVERDALIHHGKQIGAQLIIIETASRLVEDEDNSNFAALLAACGHIASETAAAVVISHHPTKSATKDNDSSPESARGGGAFINNSRTAVSLFPAQAEHLAKLNEAGLHFAEKDVLVLEHQKGTSSVPRQEPIILVRCPTPFGMVLQLPERAIADPAQAEVHARRAQREQRGQEAQFTALYDLVAELCAHDAVSKNKLRGEHKRLGVAKNSVDALVDRAITAGVLKPGRRDSAGRLLSLDLGVRPVDRRTAFDPRATAGDPEHDRPEN
jgi:AAA domain-containing protein